MRTLRDLLATWENWSAREVSRQALAKARTDEQRDVMTAALDQGEEVDALDVLRDVTELVTLLSGWRWQVMTAARERGASWEEIGAAVGIDARQAEAECADATERQRRLGAERTTNTR